MKKKLKIVFVFDFGWMGGALRVMCDFISGLSRTHEVTVITSDWTADNKWFRAMLPESCRVIKLRKKRVILKKPFGFLSFPALFVNLWLLRFFNRQVSREIIRGGYDLAILDLDIDCRRHIMDIFDGLKIPVVFYCHEPCRQYYEKELFYDESHRIRSKPWLSRFSYSLREKILDIFVAYNDSRCIKKPAQVLTNSKYTREYLYHLYHIQAKVSYPGVDMRKFRPLGIPRKDLVGLVGELSERKGAELVIQALALLPEKKRPVLGLIYPGPQPYLAFLEKHAAQHGVRLERYVGLSDEELVTVYNQMKILACAFFMEPLGLSPLEALACETPVVGISEAGLREIVMPGCCGLLVDRDPREFARALETLLDDEGLRTRLGAAGREQVRTHWNVEDAVQRLENGLYEVLERWPGAGPVKE